jgi:alkylation response protein AidB-like acyl-CoA dehydrogenase
MNFNLSEEQTMIRESIVRFVQENYELEQRNKVVANQHGYSAKHWQQFAELGWLSIPFDEEFGGFGGGPADTMVIMQEIGRGIIAEPYLPTILLFGQLVQAGASDELKKELLPQLIGGELQGAFAYTERQSRYVLNDVATSAQQDGSDWSINGSKTVVLNGGAAQQLVVAARTSGEQFDQDGITLFLVDAEAEGVQRTAYAMADGRGVANIEFNNVTARAAIGQVDQGYALMQEVLNQARLAVSAEALGAMEFLNATTLEYLKTREQFGVPIGSFQALQHRMVDCFGACENTKSLLYRAVCTAAEGSQDAEQSLLALKVMVGRAGKLIGGEAIQMHGGMGMTNELAVGHYVKRLMIINTLFGDADYHQQAFIELSNATSSNIASTATKGDNKQQAA